MLEDISDVRQQKSPKQLSTHLHTQTLDVKAVDKFVLYLFATL